MDILKSVLMLPFILIAVLLIFTGLIFAGFVYLIIGDKECGSTFKKFTKEYTMN